MPFKSDTYKNLLIALRQILKVTASQSKRLAKETGLSTAQFITMQTIESNSPVSAGTLARELNLKQATMTAVLIRLEERGLITRTRDASDKRRVLVSLTNEGSAMLEAAPTALQNRIEDRFAALENWEQHQLLASIQRVVKLMDAEDPEAAPLLEFGNLSTTATIVQANTADEQEAWDSPS